MKLRDLFEATLPLLPNELPRVRGSYGAFIITMDPMDFLKLTAPPSDMERIKATKFPKDRETFVNMIGHENAKDYGRFPIPFLNIEWPSGKVVGHEGRHRAWMVAQQGGKNFPVVIYMRRPNEYEVTYEVCDRTHDEDNEEYVRGKEEFGTDEKAATARYEQLKNWHDAEMKAWRQAYDANQDFEFSQKSYHNVRLEVLRPGEIKGSPNYVNPDDYWDRKPYVVEDMPKQLLGQFDDSIVVTNYRVGLVKGYSHFR